jgi:hypothetical protein
VIVLFRELRDFWAHWIGESHSRFPWHCLSVSTVTWQSRDETRAYLPRRLAVDLCVTPWRPRCDRGNDTNLRRNQDDMT